MDSVMVVSMEDEVEKLETESARISRYLFYSIIKPETEEDSHTCELSAHWFS